MNNNYSINSAQSSHSLYLSLSLLHSLIHSLITRSLSHSLTHSFALSLTHSFALSLTPSLIQSQTFPASFSLCLRSPKKQVLFTCTRMNKRFTLTFKIHGLFHESHSLSNVA